MTLQNLQIGCGHSRNIMNSMEQKPSYKIIGRLAIQGTPDFHETWRFVVLFTKSATGLCPESAEFSPHLIPCLFHIHFNNILSYTSVFLRW